MATITKDYKEKLKEALNNDNTDYEVVRWIEQNFTELKESEDERIRNLIYLSIEKRMGIPNDKDRKKALDWIEKQGKDNMGISEATKQELEDNLNKALEKETPESWNKFLEAQDEQKSDTDFSDLRTWKYVVDAVLTKENGIGNYLNSARTEAIAKELQERFGKIEQKPAEWSEEDEKIYNLLYEEYKNVAYYSRSREKAEDIAGEVLGWLKSLKHRYTWKPSDEQMEALAEALSLAKNCGEEGAFDLRTLYEDLKKLREE